MRTLLLFTIVASAVLACDKKSSEAPASSPAPAPAPGPAPAGAASGGGSAQPAGSAAAAAQPAPGPAAPAGIKPLVAGAPLPKPGSGEGLLLAGEPAGAVTLTYPGGKTIAIPHGLIAPFKDEALDVPDKLTFESVDRAELVGADTDPPHTAQVVTRALDYGDFPHFEVWFVPTVATRVRLVEDASTIEVDWSDPQRRWAVVILDEAGKLVDVKTGAVKPLGDSVGSPSFAPDGTLYFRSLDGGVWKWTGERSEKAGKGKRGKRASGNLHDGFEPAVYPQAVTFDADGKPKFK